MSVKSQLSLVEGTEDAKSVVNKAVVGKIAEVMSMSVDNMSPERSVAEPGMDSLVAVKSRSWNVQGGRCDFGMYHGSLCLCAEQLCANKSPQPVLEIIGSPSICELVNTLCTKPSLVQ